MFWRKRKQRPDAYDRYEQFTAEMRAGGWRLWRYDPPRGYAFVIAHRFGWDDPRIVFPHANPLMNAIGLYWREATDMIDVTPGNDALPTIPSRSDNLPKLPFSEPHE